MNIKNILLITIFLLFFVPQASAKMMIYGSTGIITGVDSILTSTGSEFSKNNIAPDFLVWYNGSGCQASGRNGSILFSGTSNSTCIQNLIDFVKIDGGSIKMISSMTLDSNVTIPKNVHFFSTGMVGIYDGNENIVKLLHSNLNFVIVDGGVLSDIVIVSSMHKPSDDYGAGVPDWSGYGTGVIIGSNGVSVIYRTSIYGFYTGISRPNYNYGGQISNVYLDNFNGINFVLRAYDSWTIENVRSWPYWNLYSQNPDCGHCRGTAIKISESCDACILENTFSYNYLYGILLKDQVIGIQIKNAQIDNTRAAGEGINISGNSWATISSGYTTTPDPQVAKGYVIRNTSTVNIIGTFSYGALYGYYVDSPSRVSFTGTTTYLNNNDYYLGGTVYHFPLGYSFTNSGRIDTHELSVKATDGADTSLYLTGNHSAWVRTYNPDGGTNHKWTGFGSSPWDSDAGFTAGFMDDSQSVYVPWVRVLRVAGSYNVESVEFPQGTVKFANLAGSGNASLCVDTWGITYRGTPNC